MPAGGPGDAAAPALLSFSYHRSIAPTLGVLLGLAIAEALVLHSVAMALWGWRVAMLLGLADLSLVVALVGLLRAIRRYPVTIGEGVLTMRVGKLKAIAVPLMQVRGLRERWNRDEVKARGVANFALANWPNVMIDIDPPLVTRRRTVTAIAHKLDAPGDFAAALRGHMDAR
jgi:hypothetical protein